MEFVYICSPYGGLEENMLKAREYGQAVAKEGYIPIIPHVMWHGIYDDCDPVQRKQALEAGIRLLSCCGQLRVFGDVITPGMAGEITYARSEGIPIVKGTVVTESAMRELARYFENNFCYFNRAVADTFNYYISRSLSPELIKEAIKQTAAKNAGMNYLEAILNNWLGQQIHTVKELKNRCKPQSVKKKNDYAAYTEEMMNKVMFMDD